METINKNLCLITSGPRTKNPAAVTCDWETCRPAHVLDSEGEPVARDAGNYIEYAQALGVDNVDPVVIIDTFEDKDLTEVQGHDWCRIVDSALGTRSEIHRR